jgi:menaquinol-cytochrome c reductase iron-sulfur subunit
MSHTPTNPSASPVSDRSAHHAEPRRSFVVKAVAAVIGTILVVFPFAAGLVVFFSPLTKKKRTNDAQGNADGFIRVTTLDALPADDLPRRFAVVADQDDAWTHYRQVPIGSVYLRRKKSDGKVEALNTTCPHAGCFVNFDQQADCFKCPCHNSFFKLDGAIIEPSPSPRAMDTLPVDEKPNGEIWVKYENFYTGIEEKKEKS